MEPDVFTMVVVIRNGDTDGNGMVLKLVSVNGLTIFAIGVPQDRPSRTGPTWTYLVNGDAISLIDIGPKGSYNQLKNGLRSCGFKPGDIDNVIITHGHSDHDGGTVSFMEESNAVLWAHDIYRYLTPHHPWFLQAHGYSALHDEMRTVIEANRDPHREDSYRQYFERYVEARKHVKIDRPVTGGETINNLAFISTPGHSPDELCIATDQVVFTGDHVLPEITPHPTTRLEFSHTVKATMPRKYQKPDLFFGLETYLRSLKIVANMKSNTQILPAHRLFSKGVLNTLSVSRAGEIIQHHANRLEQILTLLGNGPTSLEQLTRDIFDRGKLSAGNLSAALSEVVAHIELLEEAGDSHVNDDRTIQRTGRTNYNLLIHDLSQTATNAQ